MKYGENLVKKERSGNIGPVSGQKADEYTEKYQYIKKAIVSIEEINNGKPCSSERIGDIKTGVLVLNDISPSKFKKELTREFKNKIIGCKK